MKQSRIVTALASAGAVILLAGVGGVAPAQAASPDAWAAAPINVAQPANVSQDNAKRKALAYLSISGFSRTGLIKQLMFEGFSRADATYGTDATHANWNKQAARKAQQYLDLSGFSRSGLIAQLKFEGFTTAQATYGAKAVGL